MLLYKRKTTTTKSFIANVMVQHIGLKVKEVAIVVTVVPATLQSIVQLMEKFVTIVIKRDTSNLFVGVASIASLVPDGREVRAEVDPGRTNMKFHSVIKLMIAVGTHTNRTLFRLCTRKVFVEISLNICFDEIDGQNCSRVLANLTLCKAQGPKDCHMTNFENFQGIQHRLKLDSGMCRNLLPLRLYKELFPHFTIQEMLRSIDHRVQLLAYNKKEIRQYGVCYLHVKSKNHVKLCKFYVVDSKFNPIIGVNSACHLNIDAVGKTSRNLSHDKVAKVTKVSNVSNVSDIPETLREWIINHEKYKHLFQGIGHFKCNPISIEMQEGSTPIRKPARKVPLAYTKRLSRR